MAASLYDGEKASGPTPVMFASEPEVAYDAVESDLAKIHHDIMRINKSFLIFEHINLNSPSSDISLNSPSPPSDPPTLFPQLLMLK